MEVESLLNIEKWSRLEEVVGTIFPESFLGKSLYRANEGIYFQVSPFKNKEFVENPDAPFITGLLFAPDDGAAKRVTALAIEEDSGCKLEVPPSILPRDTIFRYAAIFSALKGMQPKVCQETAAYRIAKDGIFIHRMIETELFTFYFRERESNDFERPYAVLYKLQHSLT